MQQTWPNKVQPFWLSSKPTGELTAREAEYIARFPIAIVNHRQAWQQEPRLQDAETKQLAALDAIKAASNGRTRCFFYLNSQIDFPELKLHSTLPASDVDSWWLRKDSGEYIWHKPGQHIFDLTIEKMREAWLNTALNAAAHPSIDGIFIDKAKDDSVQAFEGISATRNRKWRDAHAQMIDDLSRRVAASFGSKTIILNNNHRDERTVGVGSGKLGTLFERWGEKIDHDGLDIEDDVDMLNRLSKRGQLVLARSGGEEQVGTSGCNQGFAAFLIAVGSPSSYFACASAFGWEDGWMKMLEDPIFHRPIGAPVEDAQDHSSGWKRRCFESGAMAWVDPREPHQGCVLWHDGTATGGCPNFARWAGNVPACNVIWRPPPPPPLTPPPPLPPPPPYHRRHRHRGHYCQQRRRQHRRRIVRRHCGPRAARDHIPIIRAHPKMRPPSSSAKLPSGDLFVLAAAACLLLAAGLCGMLCRQMYRFCAVEFKDTRSKRRKPRRGGKTGFKTREAAAPDQAVASEFDMVEKDGKAAIVF